jgi:hypothetical protein
MGRGVEAIWVTTEMGDGDTCAHANHMLDEFEHHRGEKGFWESR